MKKELYKRLLTVVFIIFIVFTAAAQSESSADGTFNKYYVQDIPDFTGKIAEEIYPEINGGGVIYLKGIQFNGQFIKLGLMINDLLANRLSGNSTADLLIAKNEPGTAFHEADAEWIFSGDIYDAGSFYLLTMQLVASDDLFLKGWEIYLEKDGFEDLVKPVAELTCGVIVSDDCEPNNTMNEACFIENRMYSENLTFSTAEDYDWFCFDIPETDQENSDGEVWFVSAYTAGDLDTYMELYSPSDSYTPVMENDDSDGSMNASLNVPLQESGRWFLKVSSLSFDDNGNYSLSIKIYRNKIGNNEPDEGPDKAFLLEAGSQPLEREINYPDDVDWFEIEIPQMSGNEQALRIETLGDLDLGMELQDDDGNLITSDDDSGNNTNAMLMLSQMDEGTYYITVYSVDGTPGKYEIIANYVVPLQDNSEPDNSMSEASEISTDGKPQIHTFSLSEDTDWVYFTVDESAVYKIKTEGPYDTYISLYNENGNLIAENDDGNNQNAVIEKYFEAGKYYLEISMNMQSQLNLEYSVSVYPAGR